MLENRELLNCVGDVVVEGYRIQHETHYGYSQGSMDVTQYYSSMRRRLAIGKTI